MIRRCRWRPESVLKLLKLRAGKSAHSELFVALLSTTSPSSVPSSAVAIMSAPAQFGENIGLLRRICTTERLQKPKFPGSLILKDRLDTRHAGL
jgi:hypothetical protein